MTVYTIRVSNESNEHHIYEGEWIPESEPKSCSNKLKSICQKALRSESKLLGKTTNCMGEQAARNRAAELGRKVCGVCVSSLYATPS